MCSDINECSVGTYSCPTTTVCMNTVGSYSCVCTTGYELRNNNCEGLSFP